MLKTLIGAEAFRRAWTSISSAGTARRRPCEEFIGCFAEASGRDLGQFFAWYEQAGTPRAQGRAPATIAAGRR